MKNFALVSILAVSGFATATQAQVITRWNFNGTSAQSVPGGIASPTPSFGLGTAATLNLTAAAGFSSGVANGGSTDPVITNPPNLGWQTTGYQTQGNGNLTSGVQFNVSTVGFSSIVVSWDQRHSNSSSRFAQFQYSTDGTTFTNFGAAFVGTAGDTWFNNRSVDLSTITAAENNANFAFRIVASFDPLGTGYVASTTGTTYGPTGTYRFDMVTVTSIPTPSAAALLGLGGLAAFRRRTR